MVSPRNLDYESRTYVSALYGRLSFLALTSRKPTVSIGVAGGCFIVMYTMNHKPQSDPRAELPYFCDKWITALYITLHFRK